MFTMFKFATFNFPLIMSMNDDIIIYYIFFIRVNEMKNVFISFASVESDEANRVCELLEKNGASCFIATRDLVPGQEYAEQLIRNIDNVSVVVLLLSKASNESPHVLREVEYAVSHKVPILVYAMEEVKLSKSMEYFLMTHQWITLNDDHEQKLLAGVQHIIDTSSNESSQNISQKTSAAKPKTNVSTNKTNTSAIAGKIPWIIGIALLALVLIVGICIMVQNKKIISGQQTSTTDVASQDSENPNTNQDNVANSNNNSGEDTNSDNVNTGSSDLINPDSLDVADANRLGTTYEIGDTVTFGTYYDTPITWRVLRIYDDNTMVLISSNILCMKAFDAPEGGTYNQYEGVDYWSYDNHIITDERIAMMARGNNDWAESNLRTWLNSKSEVVNYHDQAPTMAAVGDNYYNTEPGFLSQFSNSELAALVPIENRTIANTFSEHVKNGYILTSDYVYLLSSSELEWLTEAGMHIYASPTEQCIEHDANKQYYNSFVNDFGTSSYYWWLRDNPQEEINQAYIVATEYEDGYTMVPASVGAYAYGVRPVVTVDMNSSAITKE